MAKAYVVRDTWECCFSFNSKSLYLKQKLIRKYYINFNKKIHLTVENFNDPI